MKTFTLKQLAESFVENITKLNELQLQISVEELKRKPLLSSETQSYIDIAMKGYFFYI